MSKRPEKQEVLNAYKEVAPAQWKKVKDLLEAFQSADLTKITQIDKADWKDFCNGIAYQGWDARVWGAMLWKVMMASVAKIKVGNTDYNSVATPEIFIQLMIKVFLTRGNKLSTIITKMADGPTKTILVELMTKFAIRSNITKTGPSNHSITLARACSAYPSFAIAQMIGDGKLARIMVSVAMMGIKTIMDDDMKVAIGSGVLHGLWTKPYLKERAYLITLLHAYYVDRLINRKRPTTLQTLWGFQKAAITSDNLLVEKREDALQKFRFTVDKVRPIAQEAATL